VRGRGCGGECHITGSGARHWGGGRGEVIDDSPLAEITVDDLRAILRGLAFSEDPTKTPTFDEAAGLVDDSFLSTLEELERAVRTKRRTGEQTLSERIGGIERVIDAYHWRATTKSGDNWKGDIPGEVSKSKTALAVDIKKGLWFCHHHADSEGDEGRRVAPFEGLIDCRGKDRLRDPVVFQAVLRACEEKGLIDPDEGRGRGEGSTDAARDLLEVLEEKLSEDADGWAADPDVKRLLASYRRRDAVGAEALLKRAGVKGDLKKALLTDLKKIDDEDGDDEKGGRGPSMATRIVDLALSSGSSFWKTPEEEPFVTLPGGGGHVENHPLRSKATKTWLSGLLYQAEGKAPKGSAVVDALAVLEGQAIFGEEVHPVYVRLAEYGGRFNLDLGGDDWRAVEIDSLGWRVVPSEVVPVKFKRAKGLAALPEPKSGGNLEDLRRVLNVPAGSPWMLVLAWLVQAFNPSGPYPLLIVNGEQGSGKSWLGRILRAVIDPNKSPLRRPPRSEHDLMIAASNSWAIVYDNLSGLPAWLGDSLSTVSTGIGMSARELYTDGDEAIFDVQRPIIINGIDGLTSRPDLLDRAVVVNLPRIRDEARKTEKEIKADVARIRPGVLGAILDVISSGIRDLPTVDLASKPRMADFAEWIVACERGLGWEAGAFLAAFEENRDESKASLIENDMFSTALVSMVKAAPKGEDLEITSSLLLIEMERRCGIEYPSNRPTGWPRSAKGTRGKIRRIAPALRVKGIDVEERRGSNGEKLICFTRISDGSPDGSDESKTDPSESDGYSSEGGGAKPSISEELEEDRRRQAEEAERTATPSPKGDEGGALEVARSLQAAGKRVTFGNVEAYLEKRAGGYVEPKVVKRVLSALGGRGWATAKDGSLWEGVRA